MKIYKYGLRDIVQQTVFMPTGARILRFGNQHENAYVWASIDPGAPIAERTFMMVGTGDDTPEFGKYIGSEQFKGGALVWHLFDMGERP